MGHLYAYGKSEVVNVYLPTGLLTPRNPALPRILKIL